MPHSVEMPAPVNGTMTFASAIMSPSRSTPLRRSETIMPGIFRSCSADHRNLQGGRQGLQCRRTFGRLFRPATFFCRLGDQKILFLLAGLDFPREPAGSATPAAPGLPGLWMPVFRRDLGALYRAGSPFGDDPVAAADLRELRLQFGLFRLQQPVDVASHREQLRHGKVFDIGRWHYLLRRKKPFGFIKAFAARLQHLTVEYIRWLTLRILVAAICAMTASFR